MAKREERQEKAIAKHNILSVKNLAPRKRSLFLGYEKKFSKICELQLCLFKRESKRHSNQ